jgi:hypothetical protein
MKWSATSASGFSFQSNPSGTTSFFGRSATCGTGFSLAETRLGHVRALRPPTGY